MISDVEVGSDLAHVPDADIPNDQLHAALASLLDGEAPDIFMDAVEGQGCEAWRKVSKRFDPKTKGRTRNKSMTLTNPGERTITDFSSCVEQWVRQEVFGRGHSRRSAHVHVS